MQNIEFTTMLDRARSHLQAGQVKEARDLFQRVLTIDPAHLQAKFLLVERSINF